MFMGHTGDSHPKKDTWICCPSCWGSLGSDFSTPNINIAIQMFWFLGQYEPHSYYGRHSIPLYIYIDLNQEKGNMTDKPNLVLDRKVTICPTLFFLIRTRLHSFFYIRTSKK